MSNTCDRCGKAFRPRTTLIRLGDGEPFELYGVYCVSLRATGGPLDGLRKDFCGETCAQAWAAEYAC